MARQGKGKKIELRRYQALNIKLYDIISLKFFILNIL